MSYLKTGCLLTVVVIAFTFAAPAQVTPPALSAFAPYPPKESAKAALSQMFDDLQSDQRYTAFRAQNGLSSQRYFISRRLMQNFHAMRKNLDQQKKFEGPFHATIALMGQWRLEEATGELMEIIDFRLDLSTAPVGLRLMDSEVYPAAVALSKIGGPQVTSAIIGKLNPLQSEIGEEKLRLYAWVLKESLGQKMATFLVKDELERRPKLPETTYFVDQGRVNLTQVLQLLESKNAILPSIAIYYTKPKAGQNSETSK